MFAMRDIPKDAPPDIFAITHNPHTEAKPTTLSTRSTVQEWTGQGWSIVEILDGPGLIEPTPLDAASFPGQYLGQRVVTA
jgi:hypothetical protein